MNNMILLKKKKQNEMRFFNYHHWISDVVVSERGPINDELLVGYMLEEGRRERERQEYKGTQHTHLGNSY